MLLGPTDFGECVLDRTGDGHESHTTTTFGTDRAEIGEPTIMGLGASESEFGIEVAR